MFEDKVAVVSGAGRGIGRATAELLAAGGARVVVGDVDESAAREVEQAIGQERALAWAGDLTAEGAPAALVAAAVDRWDRLDIVVNNAGYTIDAPLHVMEDEAFQAMLDIHTLVPFRLLRAAAPHMREPAKRERDQGVEVFRKVVNVASVAAYGNPGQANYAAAKAGIASMSIVMARELERIGVRVNAIAPVARTRLTEQVAGGFMDAKEGEFDRFGPENISAVVGWLASDLSEGVTGQVVKVMGGHVQLLRGWRPITEATDDKPWTIESINALAPTLYAQSDKGVPPFMPNIGDN
jgi:3-oxoacyl-[acyl-carrier protein] reductase